MVGSMPAVLVRRIRKGSEFMPCVLGLQILNLLRRGYTKFVICDVGDYIEIRTWRVRSRE